MSLLSLLINLMHSCWTKILISNKKTKQKKLTDFQTILTFLYFPYNNYFSTGLNGWTLLTKIALLRVVVLDYLANGPDGWQILVHTIRVEIVQRVRGPGVSIRASEVNAHLKPNNIPPLNHTATNLHPKFNVLHYTHSLHWHVNECRKNTCYHMQMLWHDRSYREVNLATSHHIIQKWILCLKLKESVEIIYHYINLFIK